MNNLFQHTSSQWVRYSEYELREGADSVWYVTPAAKATPTLYDPLKDAEQMVLDAVNVGMLAMNRAGENDVRTGVIDLSRYGLLGFLTALPTTPQFMDYEAAYLPTNHFIKEEAMSTNDYIALFFPFEKLDVTKRGEGIPVGRDRPDDDGADDGHAG